MAARDRWCTDATAEITEPDCGPARLLIPADLGRFLAQLRAERDLTQDELADSLGISRRYLYEIESEKPSLYSERLFALLRLLGARLTIEAEIPFRVLVPIPAPSRCSSTDCCPKAVAASTTRWRRA